MNRPTCDLCAKPVADQAYVCTACETIVAQVLADVPALLLEVATTVTRTDRIERAGSERADLEHVLVGPICADYRREHHCEHESCAEIRPLTTALLVTALPVNVDAAQVVDTATNALVTAARHVAETRGLELPALDAYVPIGPLCRYGRWPSTCRHESCRAIQVRAEQPAAVASRWLLDQLDWIRHQLEAAEELSLLEAAASSLARLVDRPVERWFAGPCDECEVRMYARPGARHVDCEACGLRYDVKARREWLLSEAEHELLDASTIARALTNLGEECTPERIWKWKERGRLEPVIVRRNGKREEPLYRVRDVRALLVEAARRREAQRTRRAS